MPEKMTVEMQQMAREWLANDPPVAEPEPMTGTERRREIVRRVEGCVCRDRQNTYGDAEDNFADIAALANVVLGPKLKEPLEPHDVASFSACIKLARIKSSPMHLDNWVDLGGYAVCGGGIVGKLSGELR